ncbi:MAG: FAD-dependent oxidoreductase [Sulfurospirillaceae bacterium]|nr:FAD-dependent oxidoreductase [Sulfurospirillaceae bacterium]
MHKKYDLIIIGGGATGSGIALDATLRGLKTLVLEKNDFSEGTSSRSTKLVHGGVRYLEAAIKSLDLAQYNLVKEGLYERDLFLKNASHLSRKITLVTPLYKWYEIPYLFAGLSIYDFVSGKQSLGRTQIVGKKEIMEIFPSVKKEGLKGGVRYYDGAFNDSRMTIALLQSAKEKGCDVRNYTEVLNFKYNDKKIVGVSVKDKITDEVYDIDADIVVNATGVFCDEIRRLDDRSVKDLVEPSSGIHIILDKKFLPNDEGLMIPQTEDGRVLFMLPYLGKCLVGTTDEKSTVQEHPKVSEEEIEYLLRHVKKYFSIDIQKSDILSCWSGLRPLVLSENVSDTKELVREHFITTSDSGLISIAGGKWTSYRRMAEELVDYIQQTAQYKNLKECETKNYKLSGSEQDIKKIKEQIEPLQLDIKIKQHLVETYGSLSLEVVDFIDKYGQEKLHEEYEYLIAEVYYAIEFEFVKEPLDFIVRRSNLGLIDIEAAKKSLEAVTLVLREKFSWSDEVYAKKLQSAKLILDNSI